MFQGMKDMGKLVKHAKEMKAKMKKVQSELQDVKVTGSALDGRIIVVMSGELEVLELKIDPVLYQSPKDLEKNLIKAFNEAAKMSKKVATSKLSDISGGMDIPGLT